MKPTPPGWPQISSTLYYDDAAKAIDWLARVFGFEVRLKVEGEGGRIEHSELAYGHGLIMVADVADPARRERYPFMRAPHQVGGGNTQNLFAYVDDVEAHYKHAREAGATIVVEPKTSDYGADYWVDRSYQCKDLGGHHWWFAQRMSTGGASK
jgi:uncharacterized glyoxalase superfamily protein PhnB